jgi:hypothetical protein
LTSNLVTWGGVQLPEDPKLGTQRGVKRALQEAAGRAQVAAFKLRATRLARSYAMRGFSDLVDEAEDLVNQHPLKAQGLTLLVSDYVEDARQIIRDMNS